MKLILALKTILYSEGTFLVSKLINFLDYPGLSIMKKSLSYIYNEV